MARIPWTEEEKQLLRELGPYHEAQVLRDVFPSRSLEAIRSKAATLGIILGQDAPQLKPEINYGLVEILRGAQP